MRKTLISTVALIVLAPAVAASAQTLPSRICVPVAGHVICVDTNPHQNALVR